MRQRQCVFAVLAGAWMVACGGDGGSDTQDAAPASEVEGVWAAPCADQGGGGPPETQSGKRTITFSGNNYTYQHFMYSDTGCSNIALTLTEAGTFTLGGAAANPPGAKDINFVQSSNTAKPENGEAALLVGICTRGGNAVTFTDGTTTDIAGASCGGGGSGDTQTANGSTILGIYGLATNTLQLGNGGDNEELGTVSPGTRPSSLDSTLYTKQ